MAVRQTPPGEEGRNRPVHFPFRRTPCGESWAAYKAGPALWVECHGKERTKGCAKYLTNGLVRCVYCEAGQIAETRGYVPLYAAVDNKPVCVLVYPYTREVIDRIPHLRRVLVARGEAKSDGVSVNQTIDPKPVYQTTLVERLRPADVELSVLKMWANPTLLAWWSKATGQSTGGVCYSPPEVVAAPLPEPPTPAPYVAPDKAKLAGEALDEVVNRIKKKADKLPTNNGKHG